MNKIRWTHDGQRAMGLVNGRILFTISPTHHRDTYTVRCNTIAPYVMSEHCQSQDEGKVLCEKELSTMHQFFR